MKRTHFLGHLLLPASFALAGLVLALRREPLSGEILLSHLLGGGLFYAAPHLLWAAVSSAMRPARIAWHAGFAVSSLALVAVSTLSALGSQDPSGLPYQWLVYWPLAGGMLLVVVVAWLLSGRPHAGA